MYLCDWAVTGLCDWCVLVFSTQHPIFTQSIFCHSANDEQSGGYVFDAFDVVDPPWDGNKVPGRTGTKSAHRKAMPRLPSLLDPNRQRCRDQMATVAQYIMLGKRTFKRISDD